MPRPTTSRPKHELAAPPPREAGTIADLELGGARIEVAAEPPADVELAIATKAEGRRLRFDAASVARWCADASLLLDASLDVAARDEVELRTPMLVAIDGECLALTRRITDAGSTVTLRVATAAEHYALAWSSAAAYPEAARALVDALARAAR